MFDSLWNYIKKWGPLWHYQICHYVDLLFNIRNRTDSVRILCTSLVKCDLFSHLIRNVHIGSKNVHKSGQKVFFLCKSICGVKTIFFSQWVYSKNSYFTRYGLLFANTSTGSSLGELSRRIGLASLAIILTISFYRAFSLHHKKIMKKAIIIY